MSDKTVISHIAFTFISVHRRFWINLAQDGDKRRDPVSTVVNIQVPKNAVNSLTS